jgi:AcrR family transcriptional regulator
MTSAPADQHGEVRRLVLDAAIAIIETDGAESLSMREVARRAGVSHQAPYHYFKDRSGIFAAISEEGFTALADAFKSVRRQETSSGEVAAKAGLIAYLRFAREHTGHFRVMFRNDICGVSTHEATGMASEEAFNELLEMVAQTIGASINPTDAMTFALMLWSNAHGLATLVVDGPLSRRLPPEADLEAQLMDVVSLSAHMVALQASEMGLVPAGQ